jgi:hypothetical protein
MNVSLLYREIFTFIIITQSLFIWYFNLVLARASKDIRGYIAKADEISWWTQHIQYNQMISDYTELPTNDLLFEWRNGWEFVCPLLENLGRELLNNIDKIVATAKSLSNNSFSILNKILKIL